MKKGPKMVISRVRTRTCPVRDRPEKTFTISSKKSGAGKLLFEPGLIRAVEDEDLLDTDHEGQLIHEINILLFIGSLYMMLKIIWLVQNVSSTVPSGNKIHEIFCKNNHFRADFALLIKVPAFFFEKQPMMVCYSCHADLCNHY